MKDKMYLSYSSLVKLCKSPRQFYKEYILEEREILENKYFKQGGLFHLFILEPENFDEKFIVLPDKLPSDSVQQVIRNVWEKYKVDVSNKGGVVLDDMTPEILDYLREINLYQSYKTDQQRIDKIASLEGNQYFNAMRDADALGKVIVDMGLVEAAKEKARIMLENLDVIQLLYSDTPEIDIRKEIELEMDLEKRSFGLKGIIDLLRIDYKEETIHIVDFKSTSKSLDDWKNNFMVSEYMYWLQMIVYKELIYSLVPKDSKRAWKLKVWFPVIDKDNRAYVFPVSVDTLQIAEQQTASIFDIAEYHISQNNYCDLPYKYEKGLVEL